MLVAVVLMTVNMRAAVTGLAPLMGRISPDVGFTSTTAGVLGALPPFCFAAAALAGPSLLRRVAAERLAVACLILAALGQGTRPWAGHPAGFMAASVVALVGLGVGNVVLPVIVKARFPRRIAAVTAIYVTGVTSGTAIPALLAVPVADAVQARTGSAQSGWQVALAWWAVFAGLVAVPWIVAAAHPRAVASADGGPRVHLPLWRSRTAWGVLLVFGVCSLDSYAMFQWLPTRLVEAGIDQTSAGRALALFAGLGIPASFLVPPLVARVRNQLALVSFFVACFAVGFAGLLFSPAHLTMLWVFIAGVGGGAFPMGLTLIGLRSRSAGSAGALSGFAQGLGYLLAASGPFVVGVLHQKTGAWTAPFVFLWASLGLMLLGGWLIAGRRTVEDDLAAR